MPGAASLADAGAGYRGDGEELEQSSGQRLRSDGQQGARVPALNYVYVVPNLSPDDARRLAQRKLAELSQHERVMVAEMPGDLFSAPRQAVRVEGTMTSFDQVYWIDRVERHLSVAHGFTQTVHARNSSE